MTDPNSKVPHNLKKVQYPATAGFVYYAVISLFTGVSDPSPEGFLSVAIVSLVISVVAYISYRYFLSRDGEDMQKMWFVFVLAYLVMSSQQLMIAWEYIVAHTPTP